MSHSDNNFPSTGSIIGAALVTLLLFGLFLGRLACAEQTQPVYFYSPDISTAKNALLKSTFDKFLRKNSAFHFQPVEKPDVFEALVAKNINGIYILPHWHAQGIGKKHSVFKPLLRGVLNGEDTYRKVLVGREGRWTSSTKTIASSGNRHYANHILTSILNTGDLGSLWEINILIVPKDIDALMAVQFGFADAALASEARVQEFNGLYEAQTDTLSVLGRSGLLKRLVVATGAKKRDQDFVVDLFRKMKDSPMGRRSLGLLGLDDWQVSQHSSNGSGVEE